MSKPTTHALIHAKLLVTAGAPDEITDKLNKSLKPLVSSGCLAEFALLNTHAPLSFAATPNLNDGMIEQAKLFTLCVYDSDCNEDWVKVETTLDLASMDEEQLREALAGHVTFGEDDKVFVGEVANMQRIVL